MSSTKLVEQMVLKTLIIEDDKLFSWTLESMLQELGNYQILASCQDAETALQYLEDNDDVDIIILDILLNGGMNGIDFAKMISAKNIPVVFITKWQDDALYQACSVIPNHSFIVKPFFKFTLDSTISVLLSKMQTVIQQEPIPVEMLTFVRIGAKQEIIEPKEIMWIEAKRNYCTIHTAQKQYTVKRSLKNLYSQLAPEQFVFIHKSFLVKLSLIKKIDIKSQTVLVNETIFPLGRTYIKNLRQHLVQMG